MNNPKFNNQSDNSDSDDDNVDEDIFLNSVKSQQGTSNLDDTNDFGRNEENLAGDNGCGYDTSDDFNDK